jgi:ATP-dependent DNA helicase RecG
MPLRDRRGLTAGERALLPGDPLTQLKGIGPKSAEALSPEGVDTVLDLLLHLPRRYEDRTRTTGLDTRLEPGSWVLLRGRVVGVKQRRIPGRRLLIVDGFVDDGLGKLKVVWFNQRWIHRRVADEPELYLYGQVREKRGGGLQLVNPEIEEVGDEVERVVPVYRRLGRFGGRRLRRLIEQCSSAVIHCQDPLADATRRRFGLPPLHDTLLEFHAPNVPEGDERRVEVLNELNRGRSPFHRRLAFDELLAFSCAMSSRRVARRAFEAPAIDPSVVDEARIRQLLPFELTGAQQRVLQEIIRDFEGGPPMARLIQGDVGSGKTVVAGWRSWRRPSCSRNSMDERSPVSCQTQAIQLTSSRALCQRRSSGRCGRDSRTARSGWWLARTPSSRNPWHLKTSDWWLSTSNTASESRSARRWPRRAVHRTCW